MKPKQINSLTSFLCWCAGAYEPILEKCPSQITKYYTMGTVLCITATLASLSGGYFFYSVFDEIALAVIFGIFWGLAIFSLDRYIVTNLDFNKGGILKNLGAIARILLAICLGIVIAKPLELKIFEKEITGQISIDNRDKINIQLNSDSTLLAVNNRIKLLEIEKEKLDSSLIQRKAAVSQYNKDYVDELKGTGTGLATNVKGFGPEAERKLKIYESENKSYSNYEDEVKTRKGQIRTDKESLEKERIRIENNINEPINNSNGPLAQLNALHNLIKDEQHLRITNIMITLIFMLFELAPVLVKISMKKESYEELLQAFEEENNRSSKDEMRFLAYKAKLEIKRKESQYNGEVTHNEQIKNKIRNKQIELDMEVIEKHHSIQSQKLDDGNYVQKLFNEIIKTLKNHNTGKKDVA